AARAREAGQGRGLLVRGDRGPHRRAQPRDPLMALHDPGTIEEGDPAMIRAEADELKTVAANIHTVAEMLRTVSTKGVWDSCAGTPFDHEVGATPDDLVQIANRLAGTERIIRPYADRLETS